MTPKAKIFESGRKGVNVQFLKFIYIYIHFYFECIWLQLLQKMFKFLSQFE